MLKQLYKLLIKPILFRFDPENVHNYFIKVGKLLGSHRVTKLFTKIFYSYKNEILQQEIAGIHFDNPVGLSAGFDKNGDITEIMPYVGFGFMQVGTVTLNSYEGNPRPRAVRLPKRKALIVNYGLKNIGIEKVLEKLKKTDGFPVSISIGRTNCKATADPDNAIKDYTEAFKYLIESEKGDFYTLNISCPNLYGGEPFTTPEKLEKLLSKLMELNIKKPLFIKMPLENDWEKFKSLLDVILGYKVEGVIISNLLKEEGVQGGVSGLPTQEISNELISKTYKYCGEKLKIIGVGGIFSAEDAYEKIKSGASLVQLITGMIYEGPQLVKDINKGLARHLKKDGYSNISDAIGQKA